MLQFEELRLRLEGLLPDIEDLAHAVGIKQMLAETEELDARAAADGFFGTIWTPPRRWCRKPPFSRQKSNPIIAWWPITTTP